MKFGLFLCMLLAGQMAFAQTLKEQKIKQEMIERAGTIISTLADTRKDLQRTDVIGACEKLERLFKLYPDHVLAIGIHMSSFHKDFNKISNQALQNLIFIHKQTLICQSGRDCENVDPKMLDRGLKTIQSAVAKQKKVIEKTKSISNNDFSYDYKF